MSRLIWALTGKIPTYRTGASSWKTLRIEPSRLWGGSDSARCPERPGFLGKREDGRYSISEVAPDRWDPALYYDPDHSAPDKTYSKIGGWVREYVWDPMKWRMAVPPRVVDAMDGAQKWAIACTREALEDYGYPKRPLDTDRTAVILGNAMAGEKHYLTALRVYFPEYARELAEPPVLPRCRKPCAATSPANCTTGWTKRLPEITEDSMPGELANCIAGRIANIFNFHGPNYFVTTRPAPRPWRPSIRRRGTGGERFRRGGHRRHRPQHGRSTFVKFCKIGALSATGTRPYAEGADGFVMGEGAASFPAQAPGRCRARRRQDLRRAARHGRIERRQGQRASPRPTHRPEVVPSERAWQNAGLSPATAT
jgi:hypothetical protein